ncbi:hypothetical protein [Marinomonas algicola]|uniref:hypothetical protein n=1 Tax=Marinomonas algicola TaxID=2773454 RepID=UPI00174AAFA9|nr:hypothetical protein [Marinomonas algicola]
MEIIPTVLVYLQSLLLVVLFYSVFYMSGHVLKQQFYGAMCAQDRPAKITIIDLFFTGFLGFILFIKCAFILALFDVFYAEPLLVLAFLMTGWFLFNARKDNRNTRKDNRRRLSFHLGHGLTLILMLILGLNVTGLLFGADDLSYHLPYSRAFVENHGLVVQTHLIYPFQTLEINLLYAFGLMVGDEFFLRMLNFSFMAVLVLMVYELVQQKTNPWIAFIVTVTVYCSTKIQSLSWVIYVDFGYALFASIAFVAFVKWQEATSKRESLYYLVVAALGIAEAASTKYFGLVCGLLVFVFFMYYSKQKIKEATVFLGVCACFGTWWYIRNIALSGNPVHPFLSDVFGFYIWNQADLNSNLAELSTYGTAESFNHYFKQLKKATFAFSYYFYASFLVALFFRIKQPQNALVRINFNLALMTILFSLFWYFSAHIDRYLLPVLGTACASIAISMYLLLSALKIENKIYTKLSVFLVCFYFVLPSIKRDVNRFITYPVHLQEAFLSDVITGYRLLKKANDLNFPNRRIYQVGFADKAYYYNGVAAGHWTGEARWSGVASNVPDGRFLMKPAKELVRYLKENDYSAIVLVATAIFDRDAFLLEFDIVFEDDFGLIAVPKDL